MEGSGYLPNTPEDHAGLIVVFAAIGVCWSVTVLAARLCGSGLRRHGLGWADWGVVFLTLTGSACSIAVFFAVKYGLGRAENDDDISPATNTQGVAKALYAADLIYVFTLGLSRLATLQLISGLSPYARHKQACYVSAAVVVLWMLAGALAVALRCNSHMPVMDLTLKQCPSLYSRWAAIEALGLCIEAGIFGIPVAMIYMLHMPVHRKVMTMFIFAVRLPIVIPVAVRLHYLEDALRSSDYFFDVTDAVVATQCVLHYAVMSTSFFYLKPFLAAFDSNLGASTKLDTVVATRSSERRDGAGNSGSHPSVRANSKVQASSEVERLPSNVTENSKAPMIWTSRSYSVHYEMP